MSIATDRIKAGVFDYIFVGIVAYLVIGVAGLVLRWLGVSQFEVGLVEPQAIIGLLVTFIIIVFFIVSEISGGGTMQKETYGLSVVGSPPKIIVRNLLKFSPLILSVFAGLPSEANSFGTAIAALIPALIICIFIGSIGISPNQALYDRVAGTRVERLRIIPKPPHSLNTN